MPFTGSHPAAVLPLMRWGLVPSALVIGSMVPDVGYFLPLPAQFESRFSHLTHTTGGVLGLDLGLGLLVFGLWHLLVAPLAVAVAPASCRARLAPDLPVPWRTQLEGRRAVPLLVLSLWIGAATHVFWDEFTHPDRWGYRHLAWLADQHGPLPGYQWAQYASGVVGAALIGHWLWRWWRATPPAGPQRVPSLTGAGLAAVATTIVLAGLAGSVAGGWHGWATDHSVHTVLFTLVTWGGGAGLCAVVACSLALAVRRPEPARL